MRLRDLFRRRRPHAATRAAAALDEAAVRRLQRVQRAAPKAVRVLRRQ